jgi:hypothetical protein
MDHQYVQITRAHFHEYFGDDTRHVYITQADIEKKFRQSVERCVRATGELFVSEVCIITEKLSPLAITTIERLAKKHGYAVDCTNEDMQLEYLCSDFGGHYSTDYYRFLSYGKIRVTLRQS